MTENLTLEAVAARPNLWLAAHKARHGKSRRADVEAFWLHKESHLLRLEGQLLNGSYEPGGYRMFEIFEPKRRMIAAAPFRDRVVHHALCNLMQPALERRFIARSFSCQVGKGTTAARECCRRLVNRYRYVLKCDVRKFFPSIDHDILLAKLARIIRCPVVMRLCRQITGSFQTGPENAADWFSGDDFFSINRPRGLPIGNLTSQLWGNFYLDGLDHVLTDREGHGAYLRYTDDFLLFGNDKGRLWDLWGRVEFELERLRLKLAEPKSRMLASREGVPFCGFRFLPNLRPRILGETKRRFEARRYRMARHEPPAKLTESIFSWYQFSQEGNSEGLRRAYTRWPSDVR